MKRTLLYYPGSILPKQWLYSALLYADEVASLNVYGDSNFSEDIKYLMDEGQYRPIYLNDVMNRVYDNGFENAFFNIASSEEFYSFRQKENPFDTRSFEIKGHRGLVMGREQLTQDIIKFVDENEIGDPYIMPTAVVFELYTGYLFNTLFIQFLANTDTNFVIPSTDRKEYEDFTFRLTENKKEAYNIILQNCLPVPSEHVSIRKIVKFKKKRKDELYRFRRFIKRLQDNIEKAASEEEIKEVLIDAKEEFELSISDIATMMKDGGIKTVFDSFDSLLSLENPKFFSALASSGILSLTINPQIGLSIGAILLSTSFITTLLKQKNESRSKELSYLYYAKKQKII